MSSAILNKNHLPNPLSTDETQWIGTFSPTPNPTKIYPQTLHLIIAQRRTIKIVRQLRTTPPPKDKPQPPNPSQTQPGTPRHQLKNDPWQPKNNSQATPDQIRPDPQNQAPKSAKSAPFAPDSPPSKAHKQHRFNRIDEEGRKGAYPSPQPISSPDIRHILAIPASPHCKKTQASKSPETIARKPHHTMHGRPRFRC